MFKPLLCQKELVKYYLSYLEYNSILFNKFNRMRLNMNQKKYFTGIQGMSKRVIVILMVLGVSLLCGYKLGAEDFSVIRLSPRVMLLQQAPWKETMAVIDAGEEILIIDTWSSPRMAQKALDFIQKEFKKPVTAVINTHHHFDHTFGNQVFKGAKFIGHEFCGEDMKKEYGDVKSRVKYFEDALAKEKDEALRSFYKSVLEEVSTDSFQLVEPTIKIGDRDSIHIGNLDVKLYHAPGLHTRSYLIISIPQLGLCFTRKEFHQNYKPVFEAGADIPAVVPKLIASLEDILSTGKPVNTLVVGHFDPLPNLDLTVALKYLKTLINKK